MTKRPSTESLRNGKSGIRFQEEYKEMGMRSHVAGSIDIDLDEHIDRKVKRFMGDAAALRLHFYAASHSRCRPQ